MRALHHPQTILQCNSPDWRRAQGCKVAAARENSDDRADQNMRTQTMRCDILECSRCTPRMEKQRLVHRKLAQSCVPYTSLACRRRSRSVQLDGEHQEDERPEHQNRRRRASTFWIGTRQDVDWQPAAAGSHLGTRQQLSRAPHGGRNAVIFPVEVSVEKT